MSDSFLKDGMGEVYGVRVTQQKKTMWKFEGIVLACCSDINIGDALHTLNLTHWHALEPRTIIISDNFIYDLLCLADRHKTINFFLINHEKCEDERTVDALSLILHNHALNVKTIRV